MIDFGLLMVMGFILIVVLLNHRALMRCMDKTRPNDPYAPRDRDQ